MNLEIRSYNPSDYSELRQLYQSSGWFDELVDSEEMINNQISNEPESILVAVLDDKIMGTVTLLATGRLALFFRLISKDDQDSIIRKSLVEKGQEFFLKKGYKRYDIIAPEEDSSRQQEYINLGFIKGNPYRWFWKESKRE